jgi:protein-disulfide isomerase
VVQTFQVVNGNMASPINTTATRDDRESWVAMHLTGSVGRSGVMAPHTRSLRPRPSQLPSALSLILAGLVLPSTMAAQNKDLSQGRTALAIVAGETIYEDQLPALTHGQLEQIWQQEYELKIKSLQDVVSQKLLEAKAKKQGLTAEKLLAVEVDRKVADPTPTETEAYYLAQKDKSSRPFDEVKAALQTALKQAKIQAARETYLRDLQQHAEFAILLRPPIVQVEYDPIRMKGSLSARVVVVEFSDFSCPFCREAEQTLGEVLAKYGGRVSLAYRDFPLREVHPRAQLAAEASRCAEEQGKFWEYHDLLFGNQSKQSREDLLENARKIALDEKRFASCMDSGKYKPQIDKDVQDAIRIGVSGTPGFFINGIFLAGAQPASAFEKIIDEALVRAGQSHVN